MKTKISLIGKIKIPLHALTMMSVVLLSLSSILLFNDLQKVDFASKAAITNTWSVWGDNTNGQFCNGSTTGNPNQTVLSNSGDIVAISGGVDHVLALKNDNTIKSCGFNAQGQLGVGNTNNTTSFTNITGFPTSTTIVQVAAGDQISFALTGSGNVYQWGGTVSGQLTVPTLISGLNNIASIATSEKTLLAVNNFNVLYAYGLNANGESGNGSTIQITTPEIVDTLVTSTACSKEACAIIKSGQVFTSGKNSKKELAETTLLSRNTFGVVNKQRLPNLPLTNTTKLASGPSSYNFFALDNIGNVWSWGDAAYLGYALPNGIDGDTAIQIISLTGVTSIAGGVPLAIRGSGSLYTWTNAAPTRVSSLTNVTKVYDSGSLTLYAKGDLYDPFSSSSISSLAINCSVAEVNQTTTCSFALPSNKDLPNLFKIGVGSSSPGGNCGSSGNIVTCFNVSTSTQPGSQLIYGQISSNAKVSTTGSVLITPTIISDANIDTASGSCNPSTVDQGLTTNCTFPLTGSSSYGLPNNGLRAAISTAPGLTTSLVDQSDPCTITLANLICNNLPTKSNATGEIPTGTYEVTLFNPGTTTTYLINKAPVSVQAKVITQSDVNFSTDCVDSSVVNIGNTYNCMFELSGNNTKVYTLPTGGIVARTQGSSIDSSPCVINNNGAGAILLCSNIPTTGVVKGVRKVTLKIGSAVTYVDKGSQTFLDAINNVDLNMLDINCVASIVNSTTSCSFPKPLFTLPTPIFIGIGDSEPAGTCTIITITVNCINVPTGTEKGQQVIYAKVYTNSKTNTGQTVILTKTFDNQSITSIPFSCVSASINATTNCTFRLPQFETLDPTFKIRIGTSTPTGQCSVASQIVTCTGVNTGTASGNQTISAGTGTLVNSNNVVFITRPLGENDLTTVFTTSNLGCSPNPAFVLSTVTCIGTIPLDLTVASSSLKLKLVDSTPVPCVITGRQFTCTDLPVGVSAGTKQIQASVNNSAFANTSVSVSISDKLIGDAEIANIGVKNKEQIISNIKCGTANIVYAGKPTTCTADISPGWIIFPQFKLGVSTNPGGTCTQAGTVLTCITVPVTTDTQAQGVLFLLNTSSQISFTDTIFSVQAAPNGYVYVPPGPKPIIPTSPTTPTPPVPPTSNTGAVTPQTQAKAIASSTDTARSGGLSVLTIVALGATWILLSYKIFFAHKLKIHK